MKFDMGYPKRTGDVEQDLTYLYNYVCEMSDRIAYMFNLTEKEIASINTNSVSEEIAE